MEKRDRVDVRNQGGQVLFYKREYVQGMRGLKRARTSNECRGNRRNIQEVIFRLTMGPNLRQNAYKRMETRPCE